MTKMSDAQIRANRKYIEKAYKRVSLYIKNEEMKIFEEFCKENSYSKNNLFAEGAKEKIERETGKTFEELLKETEQSKSSD